MAVYSDFQTDGQPAAGCHDLDPFDILVGDAFWRHREPEHRETNVARNAALFAYETGSIGATEAIGFLAENDLFGDEDSFLRAFAAGIRALSASSRGQIEERSDTVSPINRGQPDTKNPLNSIISGEGA